MTAPVSIQRFQILARIGDGGMGTVFRARDPQLERDVAIKVLHDASSQVRSALTTHNTVDLRGGGTTRKRDDLLQEARMMARLSHPNVVPIFEVGLDEAGDVFVVMEYVAGENLERWLKSERTTLEISHVLAQAGRGLAEAHARGIVHRDFKPDNVLIGTDGRARVTDFGLSKFAEPLGLVTTSKVAGTPKYMAPELWRGERATPASDVFALCTTVLDALADRASAPLRSLLERGLAKDPTDRPTLGAIIAALDDTGTRRRTRTVAVAALAAAAVLSTGGVLVLRSSDGASCAVETTLLADRWDAGKRAALRASLAATAADTDRLLAIFDARATEIATLRRETCEATGAKRLTAAQAQQRAACLELRAIELGAVVDEQVAAKSTISAAEIRFNRTSLPRSCDVLTVVTREPQALADLYARFVRAADLPADKAVVELAAIEVAARDAGDPELAAKAAVVLGTRQRNLDRPTESDQTLQRAYREALEVHSSEVATTALAERLLTINNSADVAQTKTLGALALDVANKPTTTTRARLRLLRAIGRTTTARGETRAAIQLIREALVEADKSDQRDHDIELLLRMDLSEALLILGTNLPEAIAFAKEAVELARMQGERTNNYGIALNLLAKCHMLHRDHAEALDYRHRAIAVFTSIFPANHSAVLEARVDLGITLARASDFPAAHRELAVAVALAGKSEAMRRSYPWMLSRLAMATAELGRSDEAAQLYEQAIELLSSTIGVDHPQTVNQRFNQGALLLEQGRLDDVDRVIRALEQTFARRAEPSDNRPALLRAWLGSGVALARKQPKDAEALARRAIEELTELGGQEELAIARRHLGDALVGQGRFAEARPILESALASARALKLRDDEVAAYEVAMAFAELGLGNRDDARARATRLQAILDPYPAARRTRANVERLLTL